MEFALVFVIIVLIGYSAFKDYIFSQEREKLELKIMSKDAKDYVRTIGPEDENSVQEVNPFIPIEDATIEQILKTKDKI